MSIAKITRILISAGALSMMTSSCLVAPEPIGHPRGGGHHHRRAYDDRGDLSRAQERCAGRASEQTDRIRGRRHAQAAAADIYADCMRRHGYEVR